MPDSSHMSTDRTDPDDPMNKKQDPVDSLVTIFLDELAALSRECDEAHGIEPNRGTQVPPVRDERKPPANKREAITLAEPGIPGIKLDETSGGIWNEPEPEIFALGSRKTKVLIIAAAAIALMAVLGITGYRLFAPRSTTVSHALTNTSSDPGAPGPGAPISLPAEQSKIHTADSVNAAAAVAASGPPPQASKSRSVADYLDTRHIVEGSSDGSNITLDDKSRWQIFSLDRSHISSWQLGESVEVRKPQTPVGKYSYQLVNKERWQQAFARSLGRD